MGFLKLNRGIVKKLDICYMINGYTILEVKIIFGLPSGHVRHRSLNVSIRKPSVAHLIFAVCFSFPVTLHNF